MLMRTHLHDLKGITAEVHYELYRKEMLVNRCIALYTNSEFTYLQHQPEGSSCSPAAVALATLGLPPPQCCCAAGTYA